MDVCDQVQELGNVPRVKRYIKAARRIDAIGDDPPLVHLHGGVRFISTCPQMRQALRNRNLHAGPLT
jgi:hypothetical protein